jgi:hypothetical protein
LLPLLHKLLPLLPACLLQQGRGRHQRRLAAAHLARGTHRCGQRDTAALLCLLHRRQHRGAPALLQLQGGCQAAAAAITAAAAALSPAAAAVAVTAHLAAATAGG